MKTLFCLILSALMLIGVSPTLAQEPDALTVIAHDSFAYSEAIMQQFTDATGITVQVLRLGDAGAMVNQAVLTRNNPLGDVMFGVDNTFLGRAFEANLFIPYEAAGLSEVPPAFQLDPEHRVTPVDYGDVCINYDAAYFADADLPLPTSLRDLTDSAYRGLLAVENPATSSPGLAFLIATVDQFGENGDYTYLDYWRDLVANEVYVSPDWTDAYYGQFSGSAGSEGDRPLVVSYASSPPAEVFFADPVPEAAPTGSIVVDGTCFRQIEFVGILDGTQHIEAAQQFIDFLLTTDFQQDMPLQMFVFPVNPAADLPQVFVDYAAVPEHPVSVDPAVIDANRETWIRQWTETVLR